MLMTIQYQDRCTVEAVVLAANSNRMRVAVASQRDTVELHKVDTSWYTEKGAAIEIGSLIAIPGTEFAHFCAAEQPREDAAGRAFMTA